MKTNYSLLLFTSVVTILFFAACGSPNETPVTARTTGITTTSNGASSTNPDVQLNGTVYADNGITLPLAFINGYDAHCIDGDTAVTWSTVGDASMFTLTNPNTCHPTLTTAENFNGQGTIQGDLQVPNIGLVRYTAVLALKKPLAINFTALGPNDWVSKGGATSDWFHSTTVNTTTTESRLRIITENSPNSPIFEAPYFQDGTKTANRTFTVNLANAITDPDGEGNLIQVTANCAPDPAVTKNPFNYLTACPFNFDPNSITASSISFNFLGGNLAKASGTKQAAYFFLTYAGIYNGIPKDGSVLRTIITLTITHPHLKNPVTLNLGTMVLAYSAS